MKYSITRRVTELSDSGSLLTTLCKRLSSIRVTPSRVYLRTVSVGFKIPGTFCCKFLKKKDGQIS